MMKPEPIPQNFWRGIPCGHPPDPVAMRNQQGKWVCHCGMLADEFSAMEEPGIGKLVQCYGCGCHVLLGERPKLTIVSEQEEKIKSRVSELEHDWFKAYQRARANLEDFDRFVEHLQRNKPRTWWQRLFRLPSKYRYTEAEVKAAVEEWKRSK